MNSIPLSIQWERLVCGRPGFPLTEPMTGGLQSPGLYSVIGPNGCGKSTLFKTLLGLMQPVQGQVRAPWLPLRPGYLQLRCAYVPQAHNVNPYCAICVHDFVAQGLGPLPHLHSQGMCHVLPLLEEWQLLAFLNSPFHQLSGGQKTRALLARAFISKPAILFLDEPLASLDSCCQWQLMQALDMLVRTQKCLVLITDHHLEPFTQFIKGQFVFKKHHNDKKSLVDYQPVS